MIRFSWLLSIAALLVAAPAGAGTYAVGTCKPQLQSYSTISAAVSSVPAGSHVVVCPGTYPEQVSITQPLTLEGISSGNSGRAIITVPGEAQGNPQLQVNSSSCLMQCGDVAAQLVVQNVNPPGPVTVSNITVDGTGGQGGDCIFGGGFWVYGIFFASGSSGTILRSTTRHHVSDGCGVGIAVENASGIAASVTIRDNSVHDAEAGILTGVTGGASQTLTTTIGGNFLANAGRAGDDAAIYFFNSATVNGNFVTSADNGIYANGVGGQENSMLVSSNTLADDFTGVDLTGPGVVGKSNAISNSKFGIAFTGGPDNGATAQSNSIMNTGKAFSSLCAFTDVTLIGNDLNDASIGLDQFSSNNSISKTRFDNVDTIRTSCN